MSIKPIDKTSIHRITSGQVVIDLQTAVKELVENSLDAGATNLEVRFKQYGLASIEVIDNGGGVSEENYEELALKHHTSKLSSFADLTTVTTFGFRGEALSSLCALCESVVVSTATQPPMGVTLEMESSGRIRHKGKVARQRGTTITLTNLFSTLPVRRKEFERNAKREYAKALTLLNAYALGPCSSHSGVRLTVSNQADKGQKSVQIRTTGTPSLRDSVSALWGPKSLDNIADLDVKFPVERDKVALKRASDSEKRPIQVVVRGLVSKFAIGCGRAGTDRQFFYVNGRPCNLSKVQKAFNEVYRSFNATQSPFIVADFILPTDACDINVSPDKRSILLHHEANLISALRTTLESTFAPSRSTYDIEGTHPKAVPMNQSVLSLSATKSRSETQSSGKALVVESDSEEDNEAKERGTDVDAEMDAPPPIVHPVQVHDRTPRTNSSRVAPTALPATHTVVRVTPMRAPVQQPGESPFLAAVSAATPVDIEKRSAVVERLSRSPSAPPNRDVHEDDGEAPMEDVVVNLNPSAWQRKVQLAGKLLDEPAPAPAQEPEIHAHAHKKRRSEPAEVERDARMQMLADDLDSTSAPPADRHVRKKRRSDPDELPGVELETSQKPVRSGGRSARHNLRAMLGEFASTGSQRAPPRVPEGDEDELESSEDEDRLSPPSNQDRDEMRVDTDVLDVAPSAIPDSQSAVPDVLSSPGMPPADEDEIMVPSNVSSDIKPPPAVIDLTDDDMFESSDLSLVALETCVSTTPSLDLNDEVISRPEVIRTSDGGDISLRFDSSKISDAWLRLRQSLATASSGRRPKDFTLKFPLDAGITNATSDEGATAALARTINKEDFGAMEIIGQFNLGFIVTRRRTGDSEGGVAMDDLFIVDQHAADEKYNFETLQQTTRIRSQKLFRPQPLELTAGDELLALENLDVLRQNGFEVDLQSATENHGPRLSLTAQPISKDTVFDMKDLEELIHLMHDRPAGEMVRCSKARSMFAMRACRKSVMVGMPLTKGQMTAVVRHMGTMEQPWNCPHGRPTMRHLSNITVGEREERDARAVDWAMFT